MKTFTHHIAGKLAVIESDGQRLALTEEELRELIAEAGKALVMLDAKGCFDLPTPAR